MFVKMLGGKSGPISKINVPLLLVSLGFSIT
jgi:hypothetical protein